MIQTIELHKNAKKESNGGARACLVAVIIIFAAYLFSVIAAIVTCVNSSKECVALTGQGGLSANKYYVNVVFFKVPSSAAQSIAPPVALAELLTNEEFII